MVRRILTTLVMTAGTIAVSGSTAHAEEVCVEVGVTQEADPIVGLERKCRPSPFTTNEYRACFGIDGAAVCVGVATP